MVSKEQIKLGVSKFLETELMPQMSNMSPLKQIILATGVGIAMRKIDPIIDSFAKHPMSTLFDISDESGNIDIDVIAEELRPNIPKDGFAIEIPLFGDIKLFPEDVDIILKNIKES